MVGEPQRVLMLVTSLVPVDAVYRSNQTYRLSAK